MLVVAAGLVLVVDPVEYILAAPSPAIYIITLAAPSPIGPHYDGHRFFCIDRLSSILHMSSNIKCQQFFGII